MGKNITTETVTEQIQIAQEKYAKNMAENMIPGAD